MFTGIIEHQGTVARLMRRGGGARLEIRAPELVPHLAQGESVAVNGACVTVTELNATTFACDLVPETVSRSNLGILQVDEEVNLERPVRVQDRLGGHIVQGHVDAVGLVRSRRRVGAQEILEITIPFELSRYLAPQGSVALDGVSLTVVAADKDRFRVALIPYTVEMTTLGRKTQGASVNVELDILSKYVERHLIARMARPAFLPVSDGGSAPAAKAETRPAPTRPAPEKKPAKVKASAGKAGSKAGAKTGSNAASKTSARSAARATSTATKKTSRAAAKPKAAKAAAKKRPARKR